MRDHPTIEKNLNRVNKLVDNSVQIADNGAPIFKWLEISPIDVCNRKCNFCPKSDPSVAPDQPGAVMAPTLFYKIADELESIGYQGTVMLAGYGEPLLSKHIIEMVEAFAPICNTEITTNGDPLTVKKIEELVRAGVHKIVVSLYDGPEQIEKMQALFSKAGASPDQYILRDRWYSEAHDFGLKLTNRGGTIDLGKAHKKGHKPCYYPAYMMMIDWNGDVFLCTQDWNRRVRSGNLNFESTQAVWNSKTFKRYRSNLSAGLRSDHPCAGCNADGTKHGRAHAVAWENYYREKSQIPLRLI